MGLLSGYCSTQLNYYNYKMKVFGMSFYHFLVTSYTTNNFSCSRVDCEALNLVKKKVIINSFLLRLWQFLLFFFSQAFGTVLRRVLDLFFNLTDGWCYLGQLSPIWDEHFIFFKIIWLKLLLRLLVIANFLGN